MSHDSSMASFSEPERVILDIDSEKVGNPAIAPDESFLIFATRHETALGGTDLYVSFRRDGAWTTPRNLGEPVNSRFSDFAPTVSWDQTLLYWTSERPGIVPEGGVEGRPSGRSLSDRLGGCLALELAVSRARGFGARRRLSDGFRSATPISLSTQEGLSDLHPGLSTRKPCLWPTHCSCAELEDRRACNTEEWVAWARGRAG